MATSSKLSATAASFSPKRDSFLDMQVGIEQELDNDGVNNLAEAMNDGAAISTAPVVGGTSELPPHMAKHAKEFWFPESRDCSCCKGFKHGCNSCEGGNCTCCQK